MHVNESANARSIDKAIILLHNCIASAETILILTIDSGLIAGRGSGTRVRMKEI